MSLLLHEKLFTPEPAKPTEAEIIEMQRSQITDLLCQLARMREGSFEQILEEEFLVNTQNYPKQYLELFQTKYKRAKDRFHAQWWRSQELA